MAQPESKGIIAFILLDRPEFPDIGPLIEHFGSMLGIDKSVQPVQNPGDKSTLLVTDKGLVVVALMEFPLPAGYLDLASRAWWWPEAPAALHKHTAHLVVQASWSGDDRMTAHAKHTLVVRDLIDRLPSASAVVWGSVIVSTDQYRGEFHRLQTEGALPVRLWILIQLSGDGNGGTIASTIGMRDFGLMEIEANSAPLSPVETLKCVEGLATYLIAKGPVVNDGDTTGPTTDIRIRVRHAPSFRPDVGTVYLLDFSLPGEPGTSPVTTVSRN
ncbi:MAG: DUF4261 domain-containing protein [Hyphomicrobiaceae bacterium]|nr:DUF4261 domain-containing protein [Hyphomicrobiaceae bacterium]